jgi:hypothetical protein
VRVSQLRVDRSSTELLVGHSPAGKNVSTEAENIVSIRHQETAEDKVGWEDPVCLIVICEV